MHLYVRYALERHTNPELSHWWYDAYESFNAAVSRGGFPCTFAIVAHKKGYLRFAFIEPSSTDCSGLATTLRLYLDEIRFLDGEELGLTGLVVFIRRGGSLSLAACHREAWNQLACAIHDDI